jgi:crotonobetainyl-CoA:carnitine CoA-transferase CaiB-like acyl-CoA transferase
MTEPSSSGGGPLKGVRVLEMGSFIAGPFAGQLLGDYGAEVIKLEPPGKGDPMRTWGVVRDGKSLWWPAIARDKKSVCVDLRQVEGQQLVRDLVPHLDVILENFRPGTLEGWGLGFEELRALNPRLILVRVSGFGQTGPYSDQPGFGSVAEAVGGIRYTTGEPDRPPARAGVSLGDSLASLFAVIGTTAALHERNSSGQGQAVDVAIYEAVLALMESALADFELGGVLRGRSGSVLPGVAPSNVYPCSDGVDVVVAANADAIFKRLAAAMDHPELADDPNFATHQARGHHAVELDALIADWTRQHTSAELIDVLRRHKVPVGPINTARQMLADEHFSFREMIVRTTTVDGWQVPMNGVVPKFSRTPGAVVRPGPQLGEHTREILTALAGTDPARLAELKTRGVI